MCEHDRDDELCEKCYLELLDEVWIGGLVRGADPTLLEKAILHEHMRVFMTKGRNY